MSDFPDYQYVVKLFEEAVTEHLAINSFGEGSIDRLDSLTQNVKYPLAFLRPLTSQGMVLSANGVSGARALNFELIMLDVPQLTDTDVLKLQSQTEVYIYDVISYINLGDNQQEEYIVLNSITPLYEAFNDRTAGWNANITFNSYGVLNFCNYPKL